MRDEINQAICEMIARGIAPAAIIMTPTQLKAFQREMSTQDRMEFNHQGSGYEFEGLPIWRSWHMTGPSVVDLSVLALLLRETRTVAKVGEPRYSYDLLF